MLTHIITILPLLLATLCTPLHPSPPEKRYSEAHPWQIQNLAIFTAHIATPGVSYVTFTFADANPGINITTSCTRYVAPMSLGGGGQVAEAGSWISCANETVGWAFDGSVFRVQRSYVDPRYDVERGPWKV